MNFIIILQDGGHLVMCNLYFNRLYVTCLLHTNSIYASANASTERV